MKRAARNDASILRRIRAAFETLDADFASFICTLAFFDVVKHAGA